MPHSLERLLATLACPSDRTKLHLKNGALVCEQEHSFAIEQAVPVFTNYPRREAVPRNLRPCPRLAGVRTPTEIDGFVNDWIVNTNGNLYRHVRGRLPRYPIPEWQFGAGEGKTLLDIGCSWGRWCIAAARAGFNAIGIDLHIDALEAGLRVAQQLGTSCDFLCCHADVLPIRSRSIDCVFSYSVLQHIDKVTVLRVFHEIARVLRPGGRCIIQLPNMLGLLSLTRQLARGFREPRHGSFGMRYWSRREIREAVDAAGLGDLQIHTDGFFSQNPQLTDRDLMTPTGTLVVMASHAGRKAANAMPILTHIADSLWIEAQAPVSR